MYGPYFLNPIIIIIIVNKIRFTDSRQYLSQLLFSILHNRTIYIKDFLNEIYATYMYTHNLIHLHKLCRYNYRILSNIL